MIEIKLMLVLRGIGIAMMLTGVSIFTIRRIRLARWVTATGRVVQMKPGTAPRRSRALRPVVEFDVAGSGKRLRFTDATATWPPRYKPGDSANVIYAPEDPSTAYVSDAISSWLYASLFLGMGILVTLLSFASVATSQ